MQPADVKDKLHPKFYQTLVDRGIKEFRPSQEKSINAGILEGKSIVVCTPTASGKTLTAELAGFNRIMQGKGKAVYIVPLKALASEKYKEFSKRYPDVKIALASGDIDSKDTYLAAYDFIVTTSEKLDSLIRHGAPWIAQLGTIIVDEVHLLNDQSRGPTLEVVITMLRRIAPKAQFLGLSATIGNPQLLAQWLQAELVEDSWRPVELKRGIYLDCGVEFYE